MNANVLRLLLAGHYICPYRFRAEHEALEDEEERDAVDQWLSGINLRLARLGEEGAFFAAPAYIGQREITRVKGELLRFRDEYGPAVLLLDFIRQTDAGRIQLSPGELIALYELEAAVSQSSTLEAQLKSLVGVISSAALRNTNHENLRRLLEHLARDGYVVLANKDSSTYQITGKVEQLYAVLQFLSESKVIPETEVDDRDGTQADLVDQATDGGEAP